MRSEHTDKGREPGQVITAVKTGHQRILTNGFPKSGRVTFQKCCLHSVTWQILDRVYRYTHVEQMFKTNTNCMIWLLLGMTGIAEGHQGDPQGFLKCLFHKTKKTQKYETNDKIW